MIIQDKKTFDVNILAKAESTKKRFMIINFMQKHEAFYA